MDPACAALYNLSRLRTDLWNRLRDGARRLRRLNRRSPELPPLRAACVEAFAFLKPIEDYWAFPGKRAFEQLRRHFDRGSYETFANQTIRVVRLQASNAYRRLDLSTSRIHDYADLLNVSEVTDSILSRAQLETRPYFEVLIVDDLSSKEEAELHARLLELRRPDDEFIYEVVVVRTFEDALLASLINLNIQSGVIRYSFPFASENRLAVLNEIFLFLDLQPERLESQMASERSLLLGRALSALRPELDLFLVTDAPVEDVAGDSSHDFRRLFYHQENFQELHLSILKGIQERYETPFFHALRKYSQKPTGVFHALPISRGSSITNSHWIQDLGRFYGSAIFQAETSATTGGLDSLLQPQGPLKLAQESAARAFGARQTFFVTNGTSTANKIVMQAIVRPGDVVLLSQDCHKSHHYAVILSGARPVYLEAYPLRLFSMYGAVPLREIKRRLLEFKRAGRLDEVKMLLLTNITFDGLSYDPLRVMEEVLTIKPDMIFVWDEAWSAYAYFYPTLRHRTAMDAANRLRQRLQSEEYRQRYREWKAAFETNGADDDASWLDRRLMPDPQVARVRVYATQSTHKTLTALRQGSMIHVNDQDFEQRLRGSFHEAYMTHTSTSPNYQILASLDVGRRQVELEGYELVERSLELAMMLRQRVHSDPLLQKYFRIVGAVDMIPAEFRPSGIEYYYDPHHGWARLEKAWRVDEFVLDPTRVTIHVGRTGMDGDTFKNVLMDRFDIQINKTSRNSVLFMIHIGMTRGTVAHLVKVLTMIAHELDDRLDRQSLVEKRDHEQRVSSLTRELPPLPHFSKFHRVFLPAPNRTTAEGDVRKAFFLAHDETVCEYLKLDPTLARDVESGREVVSAGFVTPYPPGFPVLVPGQVCTPDILQYLLALDVREIHGYEPNFGLRVFTKGALDQLDWSDDRAPVETRVQRVEAKV